MQLTILSILAPTLFFSEVVLASATPPPGFHLEGSPCTEAQFEQQGCNLAGTQVIECFTNLIKGKPGFSWVPAGGSCQTGPPDNARCMCNSQGHNCECINHPVSGN